MFSTSMKITRRAAVAGAVFVAVARVTLGRAALGRAAVVRVAVGRAAVGAGAAGFLAATFGFAGCVLDLVLVGDGFAVTFLVRDVRFMDDVWRELRRLSNASRVDSPAR